MTDPLRDRETARLYARALVAIARGDGDITAEEGRRLQEQIAVRCAAPIALDDLLLEPPLLSSQLAEIVAGAQSPFRTSAVDPVPLAQLIVGDGVAVVFEKGHITAAEFARLHAFARVLGLPDDEFARLTAHVAGWVSG
jgi:uncharacterized membrane protein YebE (DUF533 family)